MQKRQQLFFTEAFYDKTESGLKEYADDNFLMNFGESIAWAKLRIQHDPEIRTFLMNIRQQFRARLLRDFPNDASLLTAFSDGENWNDFFVILRNCSENDEKPMLKAFSKSVCERLKEELNLDLVPSLFQADCSAG